MTTELQLPYPPSVNRIWRCVGGRAILSKVGRQYRTDVEAAVLAEYGRLTPLTGRLAVWLVFWPPDRRVRDLDNGVKAVLDVLQHVRAFENDSQIDELHARRGPLTRKPGSVDVRLEEMP